MDKSAEMANYLSRLKGRTLITFQSVADADAVASAMAVSKLVKRSEVRATGSVDSQSRAVLNYLGLSVPKLESLKGYSNIIIVDSCTADSLGKWGRAIEQDFFGTLAIIDHHYHSGRMKADLELVQPSKSSASEIALEILDAAKIKLDRKTALLLAAGIIADTAFWKAANDSSFLAMARLLSAAGKGDRDYQKIVRLLSRPANHAMTEKLFEAVRSATLHKKGDTMVASTISHAFHLSCASVLVRLGADYAFVADAERGIVLAAASSRARANVGELMEDVGSRIGGAGGGHEKVGGCRGQFSNEREILQFCTGKALKAER